MKKFISFPKIGQYKNVIIDVLNTTRFTGVDENGDAIYDPTILPPTLEFTGTVKLHGTNAGVSYNKEDGIWAQSRRGIISIEKDNAGFAFFVESEKEIFLDLFSQIKFDDENTVTIFGEWFGGNIQKNVAINGLSKRFSIFGVKITPKSLMEGDTSNPAFWIQESEYRNLKSPENGIYNTLDFKHWVKKIDFGNPAKFQNELVDITNEVEAQCPVGKEFGNDGIGEGVVWVHQSEKYGTIRFKVKGAKHSSSKTKNLAPVDNEKLESIEKFVEYAVTENRLNQGIESVFTMNSKEMDIKEMGVFLRWIMSDILAEELDTLKASGLEPKEIGKSVSMKARNWFIVKWNKIE